jgi:hypothetical protein
MAVPVICPVREATGKLFDDGIADIGPASRQDRRVVDLAGSPGVPWLDVDFRGADAGRPLGYRVSTPPGAAEQSAQISRSWLQAGARPE